MKKDAKILRTKDFDLDDEWTDTYLEVKKIRKGDVFFECEKCVNYKLTALTNARRVSDGWYCIAENLSGEKVEIFVSEMTSHPGPNLFREPQYVSELNKQIVYMID